MKKTKNKLVEEFIRVDHAGERGAVKIYEGQLLALNTIYKNDELKETILEMREHEREHCDFFENEIKKTNQTNQIFTSLGFVRCRFRIWYNAIRKKSCNVMYCFS